MEWMVTCGRSLAAAKDVQAVTNTTHLTVGPKADNARGMFKPLLSSNLWLTERSWVIRVTIVLVQALRNKGHIPFFESLVPLEHEFDLRGIGIFPVWHWDSD